MFAALGAAVLGTVLVAAPAVAGDTRVFDIPAQPASSAIPEFARQAGRQIVAPGELLRGLKTPALHGTMAIDAALDRLLKDTGLAPVSDDGTTIILMRRSRLAEMVGVADGDQSETIVVEGFRASLAGATNAKRQLMAFADVVYAENIGRFPDSNVAEAFNRIPGITISREIDGSGVNVSVRGLGPSFTKVVLNDAQVAIASTGPTNQSNANREIDLNMFPVELFTQLAVYKSPEASRLEGGIAGSVNMRSVRPFDNPGLHVNYSLKSVVLDSQGAFGPNASLIVSDTEGPFGALIGVTTMATRFFTRGFESAGWTTPNLATDGPVVQCAPASRCNTIGGGNWTIPSYVPANVTTAGLVPGEALDQAKLLALNPGLTISQISTMLVPRLARPFLEKGVRSRYNGVASFEYRPSERFHASFDIIGGRVSNAFDRADIDWLVRNGQAIPIDVTVNRHGVVTSGTFANAQWLLEARPYHEYGDFFSVNPGLEWRPSDKLRISFQANASRSHFLRDSPTIMVATAPNDGYPAGVTGPAPVPGGVTVQVDNQGGALPQLSTNIDLNNPANFTWLGGRVNVTDETRYTYTNGLHFDVAYGGQAFMVKTGFAFDDAYRHIAGYDNSQAWQNAVCGNGPSVFVPSPNSQPPCEGLVKRDHAGGPPGYPDYPGLGTGASSGSPPLSWGGSLIPQTRLASYLKPGPSGFVLVDYAAFFRDSHYGDYAYPNAPVVAATNLAVGTGIIDEKNYGVYGEGNGEAELRGHALRYNFGLRWVTTVQTVSGPVSASDPRNGGPGLADGALYPNLVTTAAVRRHYDAFLPAMNVTFEASDALQFRVAASRTMTRPNPSSMLPGINFSDPSATSAILGNSLLKPYFSNNIDFGAEYFTGAEGMVSAAAFYKTVSGFTVQSTSTEPFSALVGQGITYATLTPTQQRAIDARGGPAVATVQLSEVDNVDHAMAINGFELTLVQPLDAVLARYDLSGFGFTANLTMVHQKSVTATVATGVVPLTYNLSAYYESRMLSVRTAYVFNGAAAASDTNQNGICLPAISSHTCPGGARIYNGSYGQLDLSASLKLAALFGAIPSDPALLLDIQNLTKSKLKSYFQYREATYASYAPGTTFMFGIRGAF
jgi:TonB-dependent receptor